MQLQLYGILKTLRAAFLTDRLTSKAERTMGTRGFCYTSSMIKIAVLDNIRALPEAQAEIRSLAANEVTFPENAAGSTEELVARTGAAEAVLINTGTKIDKNYLDACPSVKYVGLCGTSTANVDLEALKARGIIFTNVADYGDEPTAEYIFLQLESLARGVGKYQWQDMPRELMGKAIGIVGLGALGKAIANLALAYKMNASYFSAHRKPEWEERGLRFAELHALLTTCEIIVLSTPTNLKVLGEAEFALLKPNSILVQASIGTPFDREAFLHWIAKDDNYAIFDQGVGEESSRIYKALPRVILSATSSGNTYETRQRLGMKVVENLKDYVAGSAQ
jgi:phosphoglycerate dehydrogenase-like enzyme